MFKKSIMKVLILEPIVFEHVKIDSSSGTKKLIFVSIDWKAKERSLS